MRWDRLVLIEWAITGDGWFHSPLVHADRRNELLEWLRGEFGKGSQRAWPLSLEIEAPDRFHDEWTDEDSILGDYLRIAREFLEDGSKSLALDLPTSTAQLPAVLQAALPVGSGSERGGILREAGLLGVGLLRGDDRSVGAAELAGRDE